MKTITTKTHGVIDYLMGIIIAISPWIFNFARGGPETLIPGLVGMTGILYSLMTNYEFGAIKVIPMRVHLLLDYLTGALLVASPWLFGFNDIVYLPHVILGVLEIGAAAMTESAPRHVVPPVHIKRTIS